MRTMIGFPVPLPVAPRRPDASRLPGVAVPSARRYDRGMRVAGTEYRQFFQLTQQGSQQWQCMKRGLPMECTPKQAKALVRKLHPGARTKTVPTRGTLCRVYRQSKGKWVPTRIACRYAKPRKRS